MPRSRTLNESSLGVCGPGCGRREFGWGSNHRKPRRPRATTLYQLLEAYYDDVKAVWEERFEKTYGYWRGFIDKVVARYLDCGVAEAGFARLKCTACGAERLLTLCCKQRGICPSCDAKRAAAFAAFLKDELLDIYYTGKLTWQVVFIRAGSILSLLLGILGVVLAFSWRGKRVVCMSCRKRSWVGSASPRLSEWSSTDRE